MASNKSKKECPDRFLSRTAKEIEDKGKLNLTDLRKLHEMAETFFRLDTEAATHVESVICLRTHFTGDEPYVGWKGLGLALREALDDRDSNASLANYVKKWVSRKNGRSSGRSGNS